MREKVILGGLTLPDIAFMRSALFIVLACLPASAQVISNVAATSSTSSSAVITWTTDQPMSSLVNYGLTTSYGSSSALNATLTTSHSVTLDGLTANTLYNFEVLSTNTANTTATSSTFRFATLSVSPVIASINVIYLTATSATINWTTDQPATSLVNYGPTNAYGFSSPINTTATTSHSVTLNGLAASTLYNFNVVSAGSANIASASANQTFITLTPAATAPNVSFVAAYNFTNSSATLSWSTDIPATTVLAYGTTTALGQRMPVQATLSTNHEVTLTGLYRGTTYYFIAESTGVDGATSYSTISNLTTTGLVSLVPVITNVTASNLTTTAATITWTTDAPSTSQVNYGTTTGYGSSSLLDSTLTTAHSVTLTGLTPGMQYDFQLLSVSSTDAAAFGANMSGLAAWAWGDSLTEGYGDLTGNTYPLYLSTLIGSPVNNGGIGGATSSQIATAMLATPASFNVGNCNVIWSGANNHNQVGTVLSDITNMVNALSSPKCFLVMGDINDGNSPAGSVDYNSIISTNRSLASQYPNNYLNIRDLLVHAYNPALALDQQSYSQDIPAASLHAVRTQGNITSGALNSTSCSISVSNGTHGVGTVIIIDAETILINAIPDNIDILACTRGYNGTAAASHQANASYSLIDPVHLGSNGYELVAQQVAGWFSSQFPLNFTTLSTEASGPTITAVMASSITSTSAVITWTTNQPATAQVNYGTTPSYGTVTPATTNLATSQSISLSGLTPNTTFNYKVVSANSSGTSSTSSNYTFTTPGSSGTPPYVGYVAFWGVSSNGVIISWSTDVNASTVVAYGTTPALGQFQANTSAGSVSTTNHGIVLTGLTPGTQYYFVAESAVSGGATGYSTTYSFTTSGTAPVNPSFGLSAIAVNATARSGAISTVLITPVNGFNSPVSLTASSWPSGITATFGTNPATASSMVTVNVGANVALGLYALTVNGASGNLSASTSIQLTVGTPPAFTLSATPATVSVGSTAASTVTITPLNGFTSSVLLSAINWPTGITGTFQTIQATVASIASITIDDTVVPGIYTLTVNGSSGGLTQTTTIALTVIPQSGSGSSASFTGLDTSTQGSWSGTYGNDGFLIANVGSNIPSYTNIAFSGALSYIWAGITSDVRALQTSQNSTTRIASTYYSSISGGFNVSVNFIDGATHQVAVYLVDWDTSTRAETISIIDSASGALLDRRTVSSFHNGAYVVWNIKGAVAINVSATAGNPVASAIFFGSVGGATPAPPSFTLSATAATANAGSSGTSLVAITAANGFNSAVTLAPSGWPSGITGIFATNPAIASSVVTINVAATIAPGSYSLTMTGTSGALSANTSVAFTVNAAVPGSASSASFAGLDTTTQGSWTSKYGAAGYLIAADSGLYPTFATVEIVGAVTYPWAAQTTDARALQSFPGSLTNTASAYTLNSGQTFTINLGITDGNTHKISLYLLDWDSSSRNQTITFLDAVTNTPLDTQTFSGFHNGQYASWNIRGKVIIKVTSNSFISPVVSGIFFN